ncbi:MAG: VWA domain-containing protein [Pseudomonadota bacterium]|nr:VWA domain-containing protein [Pseudomonadota bacterium]
METVIIGLLSSVNFQVDQFESPLWFWLILLLPIFWLLHLGVGGQDDLAQQQSQRQFVFKHPLIHLQSLTSRSVKSVKSQFSVFNLLLQLLRVLIIVSLAIALAQPIKLQQSDPKPQQKTVRDVVFVIESSASFLLPDYQVNGQATQRIEVVKTVLDQFISGLTGNRFGFVIYAKQAYTLMPLTGDQTAARLNLKRLKPYLAGRTDEAMGEALGLALKQNELAMDSQADKDTLKRVVVLISDGSSQTSRLKINEAINYAQTMNVPIYTVGVGASSEEADKRVYSGLLYQPLESASLQQIASETLGEYYRIGSGDDLQKVLTKIDQSVGVPYIAPPNPPQKIVLYFVPLTFSVLAFALYGLLSVLFGSQRKAKASDNTELEGGPL